MTDLINEILSGERIIASFVSIWVTAIAVWLLLDWLGNRNRGSFRPKRNQLSGDRSQRRNSRLRKRAEQDAAVRSTLRDAYGISSLRLTWTNIRETAAIAADDQLVVPDPRLRPIARRSTALAVFQEPNAEPVLGTYDPETQIEVPVPLQGRWNLGKNPTMLNKAGKEPTTATVRRRAWKNNSVNDGWGAHNQDRMRNGQPPRRLNPFTAKMEFATVNPTTTVPGWPSLGVDPFEEER